MEELMSCFFCPFSGRSLCDNQAGIFRKGRKRIDCKTCNHKKEMEAMTDEPLILAIKPIHVTDAKGKTNPKIKNIIDTPENIDEWERQLEAKEEVAEILKIT